MVVALVFVICVLDNKLIPAVVDVVTVKLALKSIAVAVNEIASVAEIPAMLLTVPIVKAALFSTVNEVMPDAAIVLSVFEVLLNV